MGDLVGHWELMAVRVATCDATVSDHRSDNGRMDLPGEIGAGGLGGDG